jgi:hypothetical protein
MHQTLQIYANASELSCERRDDALRQHTVGANNYSPNDTQYVRTHTHTHTHIAHPQR